MTRGEYTHTIRDLLELPADPFILPEQFAKDKAYFQPASGIMARRVEVDHEQTSNNPPLTRYPGIATLPADSRAERHGSPIATIRSASPRRCSRNTSP